MLGLILKENSFQFNEENYLQTHGTAMGTKMAVSFANIFMAKIETKIILQSDTKPREWKRYIDDVFSLWDNNSGAPKRSTIGIMGNQRKPMNSFSRGYQG